MQKIRIKEYKFDAGVYSVYLGNGTLHRFPSKKKAEWFLSTASKFLTSKLHEMHDLFCSVQDKYNDCWPYMDNDFPKSQKLQGELQGCQKSMEYAVRAGNLPEGNAWSFLHLHKASHSLKNVLLALDKDYFKRSLAHQRYQVDSLLARLQNFENELNTYGQRTADVISMPQHLTSQMQVAG